MATTTCSLSSLQLTKLHLQFVRAAARSLHCHHGQKYRAHEPLNSRSSKQHHHLRSQLSRSILSFNRHCFEPSDWRSWHAGFVCTGHCLQFTTATALLLGSKNKTRDRGSLEARLQAILGSHDEHGEEELKGKGPHMHDVHTPDENQKLLVIQPEYKSGHVEKPYVPATYKLEEAVSLVEAITGWQVHSQRVDTIRQVHNRFLFGTGKVKELQETIGELGDTITGVFINVPVLTPLQHRSLEHLFGVDIYDRFGIVLRIFKERAHTREAKTQVELAEIPYLKMRFFEQLEEEGGFSHLRGGTGKMSGAGETSIDVMKQKLNRRQKQLREDLKEIRHKNHLKREQRAKHTSLPVVAIVGYTNAGKTTLIKALTHDQSMQPEDMLFATLDSTMHAGKLPCGLKVLYVDTIGFVSDLPHELVESFQTTLEDVVTADVLVNVTDLSHPQFYAQRANVQHVLEQLRLSQGRLNSMITVLNKADKVPEPPTLTHNETPVSTLSNKEGEESVEALTQAIHPPSREPLDGLMISATKGEGLMELQHKIQDQVLRATKQKFFKIIIPADGLQLSWLHHSDATVGKVGAVVVESSGKRRRERGGESLDKLEVHAILSEATLGKFIAKFGDSVSLTETQ